MSERLPRISIVTPCYNHAQYVGATIESVLGQEYPNLEYIVLDGGSTDGSADVIRAHQTRLAYWHSRKDRGQGDALNKGFARATGDIFGWINSDDALAPGALRTVAELLREQGPRAWLIGGAELTDERGEPVGTRVPRVLTPDEWLEWDKNWFAQQATFFTRGLWLKVGGIDRNLVYSMDYDLWLRMRRCAEPLLTSRLLARYRYHNQAKCVANPREAERETLRVALRHRRILPDGAKAWRQREGARLLGRARKNYEAYDYYNASADLRHALRIDPSQLRQPGIPLFAARVLAEAHAARGAVAVSLRTLEDVRLAKQRTEEKITFVMPDAMGLSGANSWMLQLSSHLLRRGMQVGVLQHEDETNPGHEFGTFPQGTDVMRWRGPRTSTASLPDVVSYLPAYAKVCPTTIVPNWSHAVYAACALVRSVHPDALRVIGMAHSDEDCYYSWLRQYDPIIDIYVAVSEEIAEKLERLMPLRARDIVVRPCAVDVPVSLTRDYSPAGRPLRLMYAGRIEEPQKRVSRLVDLAARLVDRGVEFELWIVGDGVDEHVLAAKLSGAPPAVRARIKLLGRVAYAEMAGLWRQADVCVLVSAYEGTSVSMLEAMAQGCVPVVTAVSGVANVLREGVNGLTVESGDLDGMVAIMERLASDRDALRSLGTEAFQTVRSRFSFEAYAPWFADTCRELSKRAPRMWPKERTADFALRAPRTWLVRLLWQELGLRRRLRRLLPFSKS